jgi:hypothetical protein
MGQFGAEAKPFLVDRVYVVLQLDILLSLFPCSNR